MRFVRIASFLFYIGNCANLAIKEELYIKNIKFRQFKQFDFFRGIDLLYFLSNYMLTLEYLHDIITRLKRGTHRVESSIVTC